MIFLTACDFVFVFGIIPVIFVFVFLIIYPAKWLNPLSHQLAALYWTRRPEQMKPQKEMLKVICLLITHRTFGTKYVKLYRHFSRIYPFFQKLTYYLLYSYYIHGRIFRIKDVKSPSPKSTRNYSRREDQLCV